jgi:hypothetical protein
VRVRFSHVTDAHIEELVEAYTPVEQSGVELTGVQAA